MRELLLLLVMFWNTENFFDPFDDPVTGDDAFAHGGERFWTWKKFGKKRDDIAKTIMLVKEEYGVFPAIIGLCEVENRFVLKHLVEHTPLARAGYRIIHKDSPDIRGTDVAMLYDPEVFRVIKVKFFPVRISREKSGGERLQASVGRAGREKEAIRIYGDSILPTRFILYVKGTVKELDTIHCFVNHWPSKLGGKKSSLSRRMAASNIVKDKTDSILGENGKANIILSGDFNDTPDSPPLMNLDKFFNMSERFTKAGKCGMRRRSYEKRLAGTHKYRGKWEMIDQFLVSENMAPDIYRAENGNTENGYADRRENSGKRENRKIRDISGTVVSDCSKGYSSGRFKTPRWIYCKYESMEIFRHGYLLEYDEIYMGEKLRKTLSGPRYLSGVSDHLPVLLKIFGIVF